MNQTSIPEINRTLIAAINDCMQWPAGGNRVLVETKAGIRPPAGLYATLWWKWIRYLKQQISDHRLVTEEDAVYEYLKNEALCSVQITFRGPTALDSTHSFRQYLESGARIFDLWKIVGFSNATDILDLSAYYNGDIQQRACFDLEFYASFMRRYPADYFIKSRLEVENHV